VLVCFGGAPLCRRALQTARRSLAPALEAIEGMVMVSIVIPPCVSGSFPGSLGKLDL
ncbi:hypothetical protein M9458_035849, partial [Cirrhinus mrigala]